MNAPTSSANPSAGADRERLAKLFAELVVAAGALAMEVLARPEIESQLKSDKSPVSEADERIEEYLWAELARALPGVPIIAEEAAARGETMSHGDAFLLIDPIDGTREFLARSPDFTVNLGLVIDNQPTVGAIFAPVQGRVWFAGAHGFAADAAPGGALPAAQDWHALRTRPRPAQGLTALVSKSHLDEETKEFLTRYPVSERVGMGSSVKFCIVAEGAADVYPRFGRTMEWDTAAGDAILRAAGGVVLDPTGGPLRYGKAADHYRNGSFIAWGDPAAATLS
ncbi:3'(2'),5'-bisphosphate nucleotidase CysQ [Methylocystis sp. ATCC 49242]|uniref:3'(2'),5'-bisphosphate nucleotidase CysQ n=1 Tax=Methylocystis sp. ATCC 49242 TaxID=622637 RepID=UPI0001F8715F|nr:3'(2'),5'-bisphosphate nucleotidase CysQ [Methylocystis sp. ATCC 49242]